ncbi:MAG: TlpA disulfide reductase family protein [Saprospiraceae bacterium]
MRIYYILFFFLVIGSFGCVQPYKTFSKLPPGIWRGVLLLDRQPSIKYGDDRDIEKKFDRESELPFNFDISYDSDSSLIMTIYNGVEKIEVTHIEFGRDIQTAKDTLLFHFDIYDSYIKAIYEDGVMEGDWVVNYKDKYAIPFKAVHGNKMRFDMVPSEPLSNFDGQWSCIFDPSNPEEYLADAYFKQEGSKLTGTFMTETGDYRYLEGLVSGDKMYMSAFDGAHAFWFSGKMLPDGTINGAFRSGTHYSVTWEGKKSKFSALKDPYSMTKYKENEPIQFSFLNSEGQVVSLNDERYNGKPKIIQIFGTWCPNCMDETVFLQDYFTKNSDEYIPIISIGFERYEDTLRSLNALNRFKNKMGINSEVLYGGYYNKKKSMEALPWLDTLISYPTLIMVDKNNIIRSVHTGFSGPATPHYDDFQKTFERNLQKLK